MMKKYVNKAVAAAMAVTMMVPMVCTSVMADSINGTTNNTTGTTNVKYTVTSGYTWSVPTDITFTSTNTSISTAGESGATQNVVVSKNVIEEGKKLHITAKGNGTDDAFTIVPTGKTHTLPYAINVGDETESLAVNGTVLDVAAGKNSDSVKLTFKLTKDNEEIAGEYVGTVTYTAAVVSANN